MPDPSETLSALERRFAEHLLAFVRLDSQGDIPVDGRRFEAQGPAPIYKLATLLWLHGRGGAGFEVWDDLSPIGNPGGLAMRGKVRNWARLVKGKVSFDRQANSAAEFAPDNVDLIIIY